MSKSKTMALAGLLVALLLVSVAQAWAGTMKFRVALFHSKVEIMDVGDVEGHVIGVLDSPGLASFDTGEVAVVAHKGYFDYTKGTGIHKGYFRLTFEDGSTIDYKFEGTTRPDPKGEGSLFEGTSEIYQGSGRYTGIHGKGTHTGKRVVALGAGAQVYFDFILTYTLP
jgi:hypothetical protein